MQKIYQSRWYEERQKAFEALGKEKLFLLCDEQIGAVVDVPPIQYCIYQRIESCEWLLFNWGSVLVKFLRSAKRCTVTIEDEWNRPQFLSLADIKQLFS